MVIDAIEQNAKKTIHRSAMYLLLFETTVSKENIQNGSNGLCLLKRKKPVFLIFHKNEKAGTFIFGHSRAYRHATYNRINVDESYDKNNKNTKKRSFNFIFDNKTIRRLDMFF